jgi:hypothetical protein
VRTPPRHEVLSCYFAILSIEIDNFSLSLFFFSFLPLPRLGNYSVIM